MRVVVNRCYGGFSLSSKALLLGAKLSGDVNWGGYNGYELDDDDKRTDPILLKVVETLGDEANGDCSRLQIVEIPDDVSWYIQNYDGHERINEEHASW